MNPSIRNRQILEVLQQQGELTVEEACKRFDISPATARRAFVQLAADKKALKFWGGLRRASDSLSDGSDMVPTRIRETLNLVAKDTIARTAARMIEDGDTIAIDGGTTTLRLAPLVANRPVRILTNSVLIATRIDQLRTGSNGAEVFLTGGQIYPGSGLLVGSRAVESLSHYNTRLAFLSAGGLDEDGATNTNHLVVESERAMMRNTQRVIILADSSKVRQRDLVRLCSWNEVHHLVMEQPLEIVQDWNLGKKLVLP